jgi:peroxiredoxin Q/BCP
VLGASFDDVSKNRAFAEKFHFPFKLLTFDKTEDLFGVNDPNDPGWPKRISFLIGPDREIVKIYDPVDAATHPAQVLADLA